MWKGWRGQDVYFTGRTRRPMEACGRVIRVPVPVPVPVYQTEKREFTTPTDHQTGVAAYSRRLYLIYQSGRDQEDVRTEVIYCDAKTALEIASRLRCVCILCTSATVHRRATTDFTHSTMMCTTMLVQVLAGSTLFLPHQGKSRSELTKTSKHKKKQ